MNILTSAAQPSEPGAPEQFTGPAWRDVRATGEEPTRIHAASVTFLPGARTVWHTHPRGQVLVAVSGVGRVQKEGEPVRALYPGDGVTIEPGEKHWHGAAPDQVFVHLSIQGADAAGEQATWLEPVSEADYGQLPA